jgi:hypothetical protein
MKKFWAYIKHKNKGSSGVAPLREGDTTHTDTQTKATILNRQFSSVFSCKQPLSLRQRASEVAGHQSTPVMAAFNISSSGVEKILLKLNPNKAAGPDAISPRVLKMTASVLAEPLAIIFQKSLDDGIIPSEWKKAFVTPIFKKGDKATPSNYRPVSLTCMACKIMEHIMVSHLMKHAKTNNILYDLQHGFREKRSCETQLIGFVDDIYKNMNTKKQTDIIIMDFAKAFDKVEHNRLCHKLHTYGVCDKYNTWIWAYLSDRTQQVVVRKGEISEKAPVL